MNVPLWLWLATIGGLVAIILADLFLVDHKPHAVTVREATRWVLFYVALRRRVRDRAVVVRRRRRRPGSSSPATSPSTRCRSTTCSSSSIIMAAFEVPAVHQHRVLLVGIVIALVMRGVFIAVGAAAISAFSWVFYLFAAVLIVTAVNVARQGTDARRGVLGERAPAADAPGRSR